MTIFQRAVGDVNDIIDVEIDGVDDLNDVTTVSARLKRRRFPTASLTAVVQDAPNRVVRVSLSPWLNSAAAVAGDWALRYRLVFSDGREISWPDSRADLLRLNVGTA